MKSIRGLATGIGSLPYTNPRQAVEAVFKYLPEIPFWPQLPKRDVREAMVAQFSENLPGFKINPSGVVFDCARREDDLELFYEKIIAQDTEYFKLSPVFAAGLYAFLKYFKKEVHKRPLAVKGHITGPFTFAASFNDAKGVSLMHDEVMMQAITKGLAMKARWQAQELNRLSKNVIIFVDEPYLGCFGSAYTPLTKEDAVRKLSDLTAEIKAAGALVGAHCCGNTDWSIFTQTPGIDIINFDAYEYMDKFLLYVADIKAFLARGGIICWGIVPTQNRPNDLTAGQLVQKLDKAKQFLTERGVPADLLEQQMLLSPSCGLGSLASEEAESILGLLKATSAAIVPYP